jgi:predicted adenylyl cyclase CyaB
MSQAAQWEIEYKFWLKDREGFIAKLESLGGKKLRDYHKKDRYFWIDSKNASRDFRVRQDGESVYVTMKDKKIENGMEMNLEQEFSVESMEAFSEFAKGIGARLFIEKEKVGLQYELPPFLFDISEVSRLGQFLEIEYIIPVDSSENDIDDAKNKLENVILDLELNKEDIEERRYTDMLQALD